MAWHPAVQEECAAMNREAFVPCDEGEFDGEDPHAVARYAQFERAPQS